jgi:hypothetical protein
MLPRTEVHDDGLTVLDVEDLDAALVAAPPRRPSWVHAAALALATVGVAALIVVAWEQRDQDRLARHQACIGDAQMRGMLDNPLGGTFGPADQAALAKCLPTPHSSTPLAQIVVPGVVSMHLGDAMTTLSQAGLQGRVISGPGGNDPSVVDESPRAGAKVAAGTEVQLTTRTP